MSQMGHKGLKGVAGMFTFRMTRINGSGVFIDILNDSLTGAAAVAMKQMPGWVMTHWWER